MSAPNSKLSGVTKLKNRIKKMKSAEIQRRILYNILQEKSICEQEKNCWPKIQLIDDGNETTSPLPEAPHVLPSASSFETILAVIPIETDDDEHVTTAEEYMDLINQGTVPTFIKVPSDSVSVLLQQNYFFIQKVEGTDYYTCVDPYNFREYYCKVLCQPTKYIIDAYKRLQNCKGINPMHKVYRCTDKRFLLFKKTEEDLLSYLRERKVLSESEARSIFLQICRIVKECHERGVILRELKLRKFVFSSHRRIQLESLLEVVLLNDQQNDKISQRRGCPLYVSPEVLSSRMYNGKPADMWSLGVMLYTMLSGRYPFQAQRTSQLLTQIMSGKFINPPRVSPQACCLIRCLLQPMPEKRLTAEDVFFHPWISTRMVKDVVFINPDDQVVPTLDSDAEKSLKNDNC